MSLSIFPGELFNGKAFPADKEASFANLTQSAPNGLDVVIQQTRNPVWKWTLIYELLRDDPSETPYLINGYTEYQTLQGFQLATAASAGVFLMRDPKDNAVGPGITGGSTPNPAAALQLVTDGAGNWYSPIQRNFGGQFFEDITDLNGAISVYSNGVLQVLGTGAGHNYTIVGPGLAIPGYSFMGLVIKWNLPNGLINWTAGATVTSGQEFLDPNGHLQKVTTAGTLGNSMPVWNDTGGTTSELSPGTAGWTDQGYNPAPASPITATFQFYFRVRFAEDAQGFTQWDGVRWTIGGTDAGQSEYLVIKSARPFGI